MSKHTTGSDVVISSGGPNLKKKLQFQTAVAGRNNRLKTVGCRPKVKGKERADPTALALAFPVSFLFILQPTVYSLRPLSYFLNSAWQSSQLFSKRFIPAVTRA